MLLFVYIKKTDIYLFAINKLYLQVKSKSKVPETGQ